MGKSAHQFSLNVGGAYAIVIAIESNRERGSRSTAAAGAYASERLFFAFRKGFPKPLLPLLPLACESRRGGSCANASCSKQDALRL